MDLSYILVANLQTTFTLSGAGIAQSVWRLATGFEYLQGQDILSSPKPSISPESFPIGTGVPSGWGDTRSGR
jgi:hypothetical protein